jgi:hypothetical protein
VDREIQMIINHADKIVIITPPKTGSNSIQTVFKDCVLAYGPQINGGLGTHTSRIALTLHDFKYYFLTRHPYERLLSLYGHLTHYHPEYKALTFEQFVKQIVLPQKELFFSSPMSSWLRDFEINYPNFEWIELPLLKSEEILSKYRTFTLPKVHSLSHSSLEEAYTDELIELASYWAYIDFQKFDYNPDPWWKN